MIRHMTPGQPVAPQHDTQRWPVVVAALLTFGAGTLDVVALTHLGGVFASVMTGNLALMGLGLARADGTTILHTVVAVLSYVIAVAVGTRITGTRESGDPAWPRSVTATLSVQIVVQCALAIGWVMSHAAPAGGLQLGLLAAAAASMGLQGAAMRGLGVTLATTYLTGTLTGLIAARARMPALRSDAPGLAALIAAVGGAACGGLMLTIAPSATPLLCVVPLAAVIAIAGWRHRRSTGSTATS
jgi:uncharacterized membrane protein YoaK (UPF0700 family)